jgi:hypothetical protein
MYAIPRDATSKRSSRKANERTGREHSRRERSPASVRGDSEHTDDDRHNRSGPASYPPDQVTDVATSRRRGLVEAIANSMEPPYKKKKEYVPFISQRMY